MPNQVEILKQKLAQSVGLPFRDLLPESEIMATIVAEKINYRNRLFNRSLRLAVTKRKVSGGSRSMERFAQTTDLLSVVQTCRRQGRSVMKFFQSALMAKWGSGNSQPSLLPQPTT